MIRQGRMLLLRCHEVQIAYPKTMGQLETKIGRDHLSRRGARMYARPPPLSKYSTSRQAHRHLEGIKRVQGLDGFMASLKIAYKL